MAGSLKLPVALTIAGSDSGGGAGIQADLKTFAMLGVHGTSAITAVTAQNTLGVSEILELPTSLIREQIAVVVEDIGVQAAKTGMLSSAAIIATVAEAVTRYEIAKLVVDPVMVAKGGARLLRDDAVNALRERLIPLAAVVKGGHADDVIDVFFDGSQIVELRAERIETTNTHGSGCVFSAAIAAWLACGAEPLDSVRQAKTFITLAIANSIEIGRGHGPVNPAFDVGDGG